MAVIQANVYRIGTHEITRLVVDFLAEPRPGLVSRCPRRKIKGDEIRESRRTESSVPIQSRSFA